MREVIFFARAKHIMGHFDGGKFKDKTSLDPLEKSNRMPYYMFCSRQKINSTFFNIQSANVRSLSTFCLLMFSHSTYVQSFDLEYFRDSVFQRSVFMTFVILRSVIQHSAFRRSVPESTNVLDP